MPKWPCAGCNAARRTGFARRISPWSPATRGRKSGSAGDIIEETVADTGGRQPAGDHLGGCRNAPDMGRGRSEETTSVPTRRAASVGRRRQAGEIGRARRVGPCADECRSGPARAATRHAGLDARGGYRHGRAQRGAGSAEAPVTALKKRVKTLVGDSRRVITGALAAMLLTWGA